MSEPYRSRVLAKDYCYYKHAERNMMDKAEALMMVLKEQREAEE